MIVLVTGANGMLGSAVVRTLSAAGHAVLAHGGRRDGDLRNREDADRLFSIARNAEALVHCAADIGGRGFQEREFDYPAENLTMGMRVLERAFRSNRIGTIVFISSSTVYPATKDFVTEETPPAPDDAYAMIGRVKLFLEDMGRVYQRSFAKSFRVIRPTAVYGPGDRGLGNDRVAHVIPALVSYAMEHREQRLPVWGALDDTERDFVYVDDVAEAVKMALVDDRWDLVNVGWGTPVSLRTLAELVVEATGARRGFYSSGESHGVPVRRVSTLKAQRLGWAPKVDLAEGLKRTVAARYR